MNKKWFASFNLDYRNDKSELASSVGDSDSSANKYDFTFSNIYFLDKGNSKGLIGEFGYILNDAKGKNSKYNRMEFDITYFQPVYQKMTGSAGLGYHLINYSEIKREDNKLSVSLGLAQAIYDWLSASLSIAYEKNDSKLNGAENKNNIYNKTTVSLGFVGHWEF